MKIKLYHSNIDKITDEFYIIMLYFNNIKDFYVIQEFYNIDYKMGCVYHYAKILKLKDILKVILNIK